MTVKLTDLRGMSSDVADKLTAQNIKNSADLLEAAKDPAGRKALIASTGIESGLLMTLVNHADLSRINGIGAVFSDLLEIAGVDTVKELAARVPANLHAKLVTTNEEKQISSRVPTLEQVTAWVAEAKELPKVLVYA